MKVIVAGMPKTGTKSMHAALNKLGYSVYDFAKNAFLLGDYYNKIVFEGWTTEDFRDMYENVDAVVAFPPHFFWDEIHKAFPDAKSAPKDKLLVYNVSEGWGPMCEFLGVPAPEEPFPHKNKSGDIVASWTTNNPAFSKIQREIIKSSIVLSASAVPTGIVLYKYGVSGIFNLARNSWNVLTTKMGL